MSSMPGMGTAAAQPVPADLKSMPAPQVAPPITRTEPAYVKFELQTQKVTARMADGVAYEYWTFDGTVPGPMLRVREGDTVEINLGNASDSGVTHSIDLHAVTGPGGGAAVTQILPAGRRKVATTWAKSVLSLPAAWTRPLVLTHESPAVKSSSPSWRWSVRSPAVKIASSWPPCRCFGVQTPGLKSSTRCTSSNAPAGRSTSIDARSAVVGPCST
jgi:hypothetical protein